MARTTPLVVPVHVRFVGANPIIAAAQAGADPILPEAFDTMPYRRSINYFNPDGTLKAISESMKPIVCIDLDGTLNLYHGVTSRAHIPPPMPGAAEFLADLALDHTVVIWTTRAMTEDGTDAVWRWLHAYHMAEFVSDVTALKVPALAYLDDRAVRFAGDYDKAFDKLDRFRPWWMPEDHCRWRERPLDDALVREAPTPGPSISAESSGVSPEVFVPMPDPVPDWPAHLATATATVPPHPIYPKLDTSILGSLAEALGGMPEGEPRTVTAAQLQALDKAAHMAESIARFDQAKASAWTLHGQPVAEDHGFAQWVHTPLTDVTIRFSAKIDAIGNGVAPAPERHPVSQRFHDRLTTLAMYAERNAWPWQSLRDYSEDFGWIGYAQRIEDRMHDLQREARAVLNGEDDDCDVEWTLKELFAAATLGYQSVHQCGSIGDIIESLRTLHDQKQADYGTDVDPNANVKASVAFGVPAWIGCMVRANDKLARIKTAVGQLLSSGSVELANESLADSFRDLAVYSVIAMELYEERWADGGR